MHVWRAQQALARGWRERRRYACDRARIVRIQSVVRGFIQKKAIAAWVLSSRRIQQCVRSWLRNVDLHKRVLGLFEAARRGDVREVTRSVTDSPHLLYVRDRYGSSSVEGGGENGGGNASSPCYSTLLHAACEVRQRHCR